jgi:hypothetical protein
LNERGDITPEETQPSQRIRNDWKALLEKVSYKGIVNNIPFLAFLALMCVVYINNSQRAVSMQRELNVQNKYLKELRWKYMDIKSQLMNAGMESEMIRSAAGLGLKPLALPPYTVEVDSVHTN